MMKALIAMSGGVDSSVAAKLMLDAGYECIGCTMKLYQNSDTACDSRTCCSVRDVEDARSVAARLDIPYYVFNYTDEFRSHVMEKFARSYTQGLTPNPCIDCNKFLKFGALYERARELGCDCIVTGHYARIRKRRGKYELLRATDPKKDQSYVLYNLTQEQLAHTRFPLGEYEKTHTREIAQESGFLNSHKPDSQDICFVPTGSYTEAVERILHYTPKPGPFLDLQGNKLGQHKGIIFYTIGQHKHLGLNQPDFPLYVVAIDPGRNAVIVGPSEALFSRKAEVTDANWISGTVPEEPVRCLVKVRYRQEAQPAVVTPTGDTTFSILFDEPQRAITGGQSAVLYGIGEDADVVLGGGILLPPHPAK
ncbi:MAG: tRNA 2-thiouridine(34) synthase MnmA [Acidaminococcus sp.]|jgi:tRNA-specific 2-thiouridylase|nr:tRNA 2-thiouridine(34) synthase MnmA [Acidaminococcus sp.]MCI2114199.1 tRNA 2-thiouridine(34) synthase MnmA [Acidaminococcus sp.]MCI2116134.1 tRNA 2-thiouridine(34) synthase MnmA [Acidaminococcus sp.]